MVSERVECDDIDDDACLEVQAIDLTGVDYGQRTIDGVSEHSMQAVDQRMQGLGGQGRVGVRPNLAE